MDELASGGCGSGSAEEGGIESSMDLKSNSNLREQDGDGDGDRPRTRTRTNSIASSTTISPRTPASFGRRERMNSILEEARGRKLKMDGTAGGGGAESSADEETSVLGKQRRGSSAMDYGGAGNGGSVGVSVMGGLVGGEEKKQKQKQKQKQKRGLRRIFENGVERDAAAAADEGSMGENGSAGNGNGNGNGNANGNVQIHEQSRSMEGDGEETGREGFWKRIVNRYGSIELENKGSVARDHLALERTFLAWLRTSLAFASIGIAITQLFRLNTASTSDQSSTSSLPPQTFILTSAPPRLRAMGKPLGTTFIGISILILSVGFHRYFEGQFYIIRGKFPASRGSIVLVAFITFALMVTSLVVVSVVGSAGGYES